MDDFLHSRMTMTQRNEQKARITAEILSHARLHSSDPSRKLEVLTYRCFSHLNPQKWKACLVATTNKGLVKLLAEDFHSFNELYALGELLAKIQADIRVVLHEVSEGSTVRVDGKLRRRDGIGKVLGGMAVMLGMKRKRVQDQEHPIDPNSICSDEGFQMREARTAYPPDFGRSGSPPIPYDQRPSQIALFGRRTSSDRGDPPGLDPFMAMRYTTPVQAPPHEDELVPEIPRPAAVEPRTVLSSSAARACGTRAARNDRIQLDMRPEPVHSHTGDGQEADSTRPTRSDPSLVAGDSYSFDGAAFLPPFGQSNITAQPSHINTEQPPTRPHQDAFDRSAEESRVGRQDSGNAELGTPAYPPTMPSTNRRNSNEHSRVVDGILSLDREQSDPGARVGGGGRRYQASVKSGSSGE